MQRPLALLFVGTFLVMLALPGVNMVFQRIPQRPLNGVVEPAKRPSLHYSDLESEKFQKDFTSWFDLSYGLRPTATRLDNSINYYVFGETRSDHRVFVGRGGVLFNDDHLIFYNRTDNNSDRLELLAQKTRQAQDLLSARGKYLIPIIIPSKVRFFPEAIPQNEVLPRSSPRPAERLTEEVAAAFGRFGATWVDGRSVLSGLERPAIYSIKGRHVNAPASCRMLVQAFAEARKHIRTPIPPLDCSYQMIESTRAIRSEEDDLSRLLNVWGDLPVEPIPRMPRPPKEGPNPDGAKTLVMGSSFAWRPIFEAERNYALGGMVLFYYNATVVPRGPGEPYPVPDVHSDEWRALVLDRELIIFPLIEEYVPGNNELEFLAALIENLER